MDGRACAGACQVILRDDDRELTPAEQRRALLALAAFWVWALLALSAAL